MSILNYRVNKPLFIIPCSDKKAMGRQAAATLYQGLGYLPIVKQKIFTFGVDFNLAFLSAKHGLIMWDEIISPYDQKLTKGSVDALVDKTGNKALVQIDSLSPSAIVACLPMLYMMAFEGMIEGYNDCPIQKPPAGGGIGYQRQFLSQQLEKHVPKSLSVICFNKSSKSYMNYTSVIVRKGNVITPWMGNDSSFKPVFSPQVEVIDIEGEYGLEVAVDCNGDHWSSFDIKQGFNEDERKIISAKSGDRTLWFEGYKHTIELAEVEREINQAKINMAA